MDTIVLMLESGIFQIICLILTSLRNFGLRTEHELDINMKLSSSHKIIQYFSSTVLRTHLGPHCLFIPQVSMIHL